MAGPTALPAACAVPQNGPLAEREFPEAEHPYRGAFQRDCGRIIHSRAFRRLAGKTQVFTSGGSDHFRSRLTHTMEVVQIARTLANVLRLDEDPVGVPQRGHQRRGQLVALHVADHYLGPGPMLAVTGHRAQTIAAIPGMAVAAEVTSTLKIGSRMLCVGYHNAVVLAKLGRTSSIRNIVARNRCAVAWRRFGRRG